MKPFTIKNLIKVFIYSLSCVLLLSGCEKNDTEPDNCAEYEELSFDMIVHNNYNTSKQVSASNQELHDNGDFAECIPGQMVVHFDGESYNSFYTAANETKQISSKTWTKNGSTEVVFRSAQESVKLLITDGKTVELEIDADGKLHNK